MKKFLAVFLIALMATPALAVEYKFLSFGSDVSTSAGKTITVNISAAPGRKVAIYNIFARSDLSTSVVQFQEANASGVTTSYTTKSRFDVGAATKQWGSTGSPLIVGNINYGYRFLLDSTTANSMVITYGYE